MVMWDCWVSIGKRTSSDFFSGPNFRVLNPRLYLLDVHISNSFWTLFYNCSVKNPTDLFSFFDQSCPWYHNDKIHLPTYFSDMYHSKNQNFGQKLGDGNGTSSINIFSFSWRHSSKATQPLAWHWLWSIRIWYANIVMCLNVRLDKIGSDWIRLDQIGSDWIRLDQIGSDWNRLDQTWSNLKKLETIGSNWIKLDEVGLN